MDLVARETQYSVRATEITNWRTLSDKAQRAMRRLLFVIGTTPDGTGCPTPEQKSEIGPSGSRSCHACMHAV